MQELGQILWQIWQFTGWNGLNAIATIISTATFVTVTFILPNKKAKNAHTTSNITMQHDKRRRRHRR
jgi:hypothetical protein